MAEVYVCNKDRSKVYKFPLPPTTYPEYSKSAKNEEFETFNNGIFNIIGEVGLMEIPLSGILPTDLKRYSYRQSDINGYSIVNFIVGAMHKKEPIRLIINRNADRGLPPQMINSLVSIEDFKWQENNFGDISYEATFKEYRDYV